MTPRCADLGARGVLAVRGARTARELATLQSKDFIAYDCRFALLLRPMANATPGKAGEFDESFMPDQESIPRLGPDLALLESRHHPDLPLLSLDLTTHHAHVTQACQHSGIQERGNLPYSFRCAGASADLLTGRRSLVAGKAGGRWRSDSSVKRYGEAAHALSEEAEYELSAAAPGRAAKQGLLTRFRRAAPLPPLPL